MSIKNIQIIIIILLSLLLIPLNFNELTNFLYPEDDNKNAETLKLIFSFFGGIALLFGLYVSYRRVKAFENNVLKQNADLQLNKDSQINEQFKNAIEHLGSEKEPIVLGGIAELHEIASNHGDKYLDVITNIFGSYIRSIGNKNKNRKEIKNTLLQAIMNCLFKTNIYDTTNLNLRSSDLSSLELNHFSFTGVDFSFCILPMSLNNVSFKNCNLSKQIKNFCIWNEIKFDNCSMFGSFFQKASFENIDFINPKIKLQTSFFQCEFKNVHFNFKEAYDIKFVRNHFESCGFTGIKYLKCDFTASSFDNVLFKNCSFDSHNFLGCDFRNSIFQDGGSFNSDLIGIGNQIWSNVWNTEDVLNKKNNCTNDLTGLTNDGHNRLNCKEVTITPIDISEYLKELNEFVEKKDRELKNINK